MDRDKADPAAILEPGKPLVRAAELVARFHEVAASNSAALEDLTLPR